MVVGMLWQPGRSARGVVGVRKIAKVKCHSTAHSGRPEACIYTFSLRCAASLDSPSQASSQQSTAGRPDSKRV